MRPILLREAFLLLGPAVIDIHDVHRPVSDIRQHIDAPELPQMVYDGGKALEKNIRADKINVVLHTPESEIRAAPLKQVFLESVLLLTDLGEGQPRRNVDTGRGLFADIQLPSNGGKGQDVVVAVHHLVGGELLVFLTDQIIAAPIDQQIALECRLLIERGHAGFETAVGGFDVAIAVVDADDDETIIDYVHSDTSNSLFRKAT